MVYNFNGKNLRIPDEDLKRNMEILHLTKDEAIQLWLEDEGYLENAVVEELTAKAKTNKISREAKSDKPRKQVKRERKPDLEKEKIIDILANCLIDNADVLKLDANAVEIVNKGKIIEFTIGENHYKLDLIKKRAKK